MELAIYLTLFASAINNVVARDHTKMKCTSHCTLSDKKDLSCWNNTLPFFEEILLDQIRGYISAQTAIAIWKSNHDAKMDWVDAVEKSVRNLMRISPPDIEDENGITDIIMCKSVVQSLINNAKALFETQPKIGFIPPCPLGCEIEHDTYKRMFIGSVIGSGVLFLLILVLSMYHYKKVKKSVKRDEANALQNYELTLTKKSKQTFKFVDVEI